MRAELGIMLAISLHAVTDEVRDMLVPINKNGIKELLAVCRLPGGEECSSHYLRIRHARWCQRSEADARELCRLISGHPAKVNMIPSTRGPARV